MLSYGANTLRLLQAIHVFDVRAFGWCLKLKHREMMIQVSRWISSSANGHLYFFAGFLSLVLQHWQLAAVIATGFFTERSLYFILKNKLKRNRPQQAIPGYQSVIQPSDQFSFPSGHTSAAFLFTGIFGAFYPVLGLSLLPWAIAVGLSRVFLGVHFPTDTVAGAIMGYTIAQLSLSFVLLF